MPNKLTFHWTVGNYEQVFDDYHFCICYDKLKDKAYLWKNPRYKPEDNDNTSDGKYAPHCKGCNTGNIGVGICSMVGFDLVNKKTKAPLNQKQFELACKLGAELAYKYKFKINQETIATHAERNVGRKIDIDYLPFLPKFTKQQCYDLFRRKTQWYYNKILENNGKLDLL